MTLSISNQPSVWHRTTHLPKRASLLSDATIDPFPQRAIRSASLIEHHIFRRRLDDPELYENGRRSTVPYLPQSLDSHLAPPSPSSILLRPSIEDQVDLLKKKKRKASDMAEKEGQDSSSPISTGQAPETGSGYCLCQPEPKIPRPRNAFILYRQHQQAAVVRKYPGLPNPEISKIIGEQWSKLAEDQKNRWKALAEEEKARHAQQYPDYRYQPRRSGRYSAGSSGQGSGQSSTGSKVDPQGNCIKCGGKTMNPPTTPHAALTPQTQRSQDRERLVSPPHGGSSYDSRDPHSMIHASYHPRDPRHDPRYHPGYRPSMSGPPPPSSAIELHGHDIKRRRFDGGGIYIPTREYREGPGYSYSPRAPPPYHRTEMLPHDMHGPSTAIVSPPRAIYPPPPIAGQPPPTLQPIRATQQHGRDPNLKLPPLTTPKTPSNNAVPSSQTIDKPAQTQKSGLEAMIMSIPVLNKIKILSTVSPSLTNPHPTSPPVGTRGAVVAVEGSDLKSVMSMMNSLRTLLESDGKFVVEVFTGPNPTEMFGGPRDPITGRRSLKGPLGTADVLRLVGEWHKISAAMRKFITTRPGADAEAGEADKGKRVSNFNLDEDSEGASPSKANAFTETNTLDVTMTDVPVLKSTKTPDRVTFDLPDESEANPSPVEGDKDKATSPKSGLSPKTLSRASDLRITTPPVTRSLSRSESSPSSATMAPPPAPAAKLDTVPPPSPSKSTIPITPTQPITSSLPTPSRQSLASAGPIPIALIAQYQLTTTNNAAINTQISDSYSPGSHWQWVAALWRGAIGPDVTIAIRPANLVSSNGGAAAAADDNASEPPLSDERLPGHANAPPRERTGSAMMAAATGRGSASQPGGLSVGSVAKAPVAGPGVEVRLLDYRAVVVRTVAVEKKNSEKDLDGVGRGVTATLQAQTEEEKKADEFWEKAKRRVGFEVAEFLRR